MSGRRSAAGGGTGTDSQVRAAVETGSLLTRDRHGVGAWVMTSALWVHARPPEAVLQALGADERLEKARLDFPVTLADYLTTLAIGLDARAAG
jgi:Tetracyclin repressor-like, C-terminal domain